jgi:hypothetical protein
MVSRKRRPQVTEASTSQLAQEENQERESANDLIAIDPFRAHLSDLDIAQIVGAAQFTEFMVAHDLVQGWVGDTDELWYVFGERDGDAARSAISIINPPDNAEQFYDALLSHPVTAERIASAGSVDFSRVPPDTLTETELRSLLDTGRFRGFVDAYGLTSNFTHGQTGEIVEPSSLKEFKDKQARALNATSIEVIGRFKGVLLEYLEPTLAFYDQHFLLVPPGTQIQQGVLDLFTLYLQTHSQEDISRALTVYFGVHDADANTTANSVFTAFMDFIENARSPLSRKNVLVSRGAQRAVIEAALDALPDSGQSVSAARPFEALDETWGTIVSILLSDEGLMRSLPYWLPRGLVDRVYKRLADVAALTQRVQSIESLGDVYGLIHLFKESATDRAYLYERIIGIPESLVDKAAAAPPPPAPMRQVCEACHETPIDPKPARPPGEDVTQAEWALALELAQARNAQAAWDLAVGILVLGGSILTGLAAGALTGGLGWGVATVAAVAAAGGAAAVAGAYEVHQAGVTEQIASGADATKDLHHEFGLGSEEFLVWAERNLDYTRGAALGNVLVAIATAPIPVIGGTLGKKIFAIIAMGGLDGICMWLVDNRLNDADFLVETHVLKGGTPETADTPVYTLVISVLQGAVFAGVIGGVIEGGLHSARRIFFHVDMGTGQTRVTLEDGADVTTQIEALNQQLRQGESGHLENAGSGNDASAGTLPPDPVAPETSFDTGAGAVRGETSSVPDMAPLLKAQSRSFMVSGESHRLILKKIGGKVVGGVCSNDCPELAEQIMAAIGSADIDPVTRQKLNDLLEEVNKLNGVWETMAPADAESQLNVLRKRFVESQDMAREVIEAEAPADAAGEPGMFQTASPASDADIANGEPAAGAIPGAADTQATEAAVPPRRGPVRKVNRPQGQPRTVNVWVNPNTMVYHLPGSRYYGSTELPGSVMTQAEAERLGYSQAGTPRAERLKRKVERAEAQLASGKGKSSANLEGLSIAESQLEWHGADTPSRFARHKQNFSSLANIMEEKARQLAANGLGNLLPTVNRQVLTTPVDLFIDTNTALRNAWNRLSREDQTKFLGEIGARNVDAREPDIVEFFLDDGRIVVWDITEDPLGRLHRFKSDFYKAVIENMCGPQGPQVWTADIDPTNPMLGGGPR